MDIPSPPPTTTTTATSPVKPLDPDDRTTPKPLPPPFTNGVLKRHKPRHHNPNPNPNPVVVTYKECLKNHAASMGGHAVDGCGEFMPSPTSTPTDPKSIKCAACGCHRNFHRRDPDGPLPFPNPPLQHVIEYQPHHRHHPPPPPPPQPLSVAGVREPSDSPPDSPSPPPISSSYYPSAPHMLLALSSGLSGTLPETQNIQNHPAPVSGGSKKRFRTKFTQDQKDKMHELAERVGWKMQKKDEDMIVQFCNEIGVDKGVFKVWMHNNKMTFGGKKDSGHQLMDSGSSGGGGVDFLIGRTNQHHQQQHQYQYQHSHHQEQEQEQEQEREQVQNNDSISSGGGNVVGTNGSSSSS